jgi:hypothetical protein
MDKSSGCIVYLQDVISSCGPCVKMLTKPRRWQIRAVSCIHHAVSVIIVLVVAEHILHSNVYLSTFLQDTECDLLEVIKEFKTVIEMLWAERQDESVWDELYRSALNLAKSFDISESMPRRRAVLTHGHAGQLPGVPTSIGAQCKSMYVVYGMFLMFKHWLCWKYQYNKYMFRLYRLLHFHSCEWLCR